MHKPDLTFVAGAIAAVLALAIPLPAQISGGSHNPPQFAGDLSQSIAKAKAEFALVLAEALSPENIQAMLRQNKDTADETTAVINFDDVSAPCGFGNTGPLRGREQFAGFLAPGQDGGAILNGCSNFGVDPHSEPNFLAFNNESFYFGGGVPKLPERIYVGRNKSSVSLWVSGGASAGFPIAVAAIGAGGVEGVVTATTSSDWVQLTITGTEIGSILLIGNPLWLVVDDIAAQ